MRTLVATVGTNPMPVVLSCLTLAMQPDGLDQVVLVHSSDTPFGAAGTGRVAERIEQLLAQLLPQMQDLSRIPLGAGPVVADIDSVQKALHEHVDDLVRIHDDDPILLDYTGGTKAMTAGAVRWHLEMTGDSDESAELRFYVDETTGMIWPDHGEPLPFTVSAQMSLAQMAALHGLTLTPNAQAPNRDETQIYEWFSAAVQAHERRNVCAVCDGLGITTGPGVGEVVLNAGITESEGGAWQPWRTEIDVLVRWGHRVLAVEAKTYTEQFHLEGGWDHGRAQAAFGGATQSWFVSSGPGQQPVATGVMRDYVPWSGIEPGSDTLAALTHRGHEAVTSFHRFFPARQQNEAAIDHPAVAARAAGTVLVSAVGSSRMAPVAALAYARAREGEPDVQVHLLMSPQYGQGEATELVQAIQAVPGAVTVRQHRVALTSAAVTAVVSTILAAAAGGRVVLDVTAGTKAATAGMVIAAHRFPQVEVVCTDARQRIRSTAGHGSKPLAPITLPVPALLESHYRRYDLSDVPGTVPQDLRALITLTAAQLPADPALPDPALAVWLPYRLRGVGGDHQLSLAILSAWDRLIGLVLVPGQVRHAVNGEPITTTHAQIANCAATGALYLEALAGDATRTVVGFRRTPGSDNESQTLRSRIEGRLALAHPSQDRRIQVVLFNQAGVPDAITADTLSRMIGDLYGRRPAAPAGTS